MEVSSHALALKRVDGMRFAAGDLHQPDARPPRLPRGHGDLLRGEAPAVRDAAAPTRPASINLDDPRGAALLETSAARRSPTASRSPPTSRRDRSTLTLGGLAFDVRTPQGTVRDPVDAGRPAERLQHPRRRRRRPWRWTCRSTPIERGVRSAARRAGPLRGRVGADDDVTVVVDYAHTDDALRNLLETARPLAPQRLITVFGCGGDRDRTKRPLMGMVAARLSDVVVITSDNPRSEDPRAHHRGDRARHPRRPTPADGARRRADAWSTAREAIDRAVGDGARPAMSCSIAGKGHEKYQQIGDRVLPFDDVAVAREALARRRRSDEGDVVWRAMATDRPRCMAERDARRARRGRPRPRDDGFVDRLADDRGRASCSSPSSPRATGTSSRPTPLARGAGGGVGGSEAGRCRRLARGRCDRSGGRPRAALQDLARAVRRESGATVVAITGSAGKTTTKETIAASARARVHGGEEPREPEQPPRAAALAARAAAGAGRRGDGAGHEPRGRNSVAGRHRRAGDPCVDQRRRRAHRLLRVARTRLPMPRPRSSRGAARRRCSSCNADDPLVMARAAAFAGRVGDVRRRRERPTCGPRTSRTSASTASQRDVVTPSRRTSAARCRCSAAATWRTCSRATAVAHRAAACRSTRSSRRAATLAPAAASRRSASGSRDGMTVIDDTYNSSPSALKRALEVLASEPPARAARRGAGRDAGAGRSRDRAARGLRPRGRGRAARRAGHGRRRAGGGARRARRSRQACAAARVATCRPARKPPTRSAALVRAGRRRAGEGLARRQRRTSSWIGSWRSAADALPPPASRSTRRCRVLQRDALHHVPHRGGEPDGARHQPRRSGRG